MDDGDDDGDDDDDDDDDKRVCTKCHHKCIEMDDDDFKVIFARQPERSSK